jgi:hypothetical protein
MFGAADFSRYMTLAQKYAFEDDLKPDHDQELLAVAVIENRLRVVSLLRDGSYHFVDETARFHSLLYSLSADTLALAQAADEFEHLINDPNVKEQALHEFFETHPDFLLTSDYKRAHSKIVLERTDTGALIPDFILEPVNRSQFCDLLELKSPMTPLFVMKKNRRRFSAAVLEAVAQLREYQRFFDERDSRERIHARYGLTAYRPRMFLILGRTGTVDPFMMKVAQENVSDVTIATYDDILGRMKNRLAKYQSKQDS